MLTEVSPANGSLVSNLGANLVATFDEPVIAANGSIALRNLTDATATAFNIGDPAVTIAGNTLTLNPPTNLLYGKDYALQISSNALGDSSNNPFSGINNDTTWSFTAILADPIAHAGGPYVVPLLGSLAPNGSVSAPSYLQTIDLCEWDLNNDGTFGDVTGATPAAITEAVLTSTWGMNVGLNTIGLRVTDSAAMTATATTTVKIGIILSWDANGATANQTDGTAAWLDANQWRESGINTGWTSGAAAIFGNGGTAGTVTLGGNTTVASFTFNAFSNTYTAGTSISTMKLNSGITKNTGSGAVSIASPLALGAAQTWTNNSTTTLTGGRTLNIAAFNLTINGNGGTNLNQGILSGTGGLVRNGAGTLVLGGAGTPPAHRYSGPTVINGGVMMVNSNKTTSNITLNHGMLTDYYRATTAFTGVSGSGCLGTGNNQIQIYGDSGFGGGYGNCTWRIG